MVFGSVFFAMCAFDTGVSFAFILAYNSFIYYSLAPPRFDLLPRLSYWQLVYAAAHSSIGLTQKLGHMLPIYQQYRRLNNQTRMLGYTTVATA